MISQMLEDPGPISTPRGTYQYRRLISLVLSFWGFQDWRHGSIDGLVLL
jgi:hypothetical protein